MFILNAEGDFIEKMLSTQRKHIYIMFFAEANNKCMFNEKALSFAPLYNFQITCFRLY